MTGREIEIVRYLSEDNHNRLLTEIDDEKVSKRLTFIKWLYQGAQLNMQLRMSECLNRPEVAGSNSEIRVVLDS